MKRLMWGMLILCVSCVILTACFQWKIDRLEVSIVPITEVMEQGDRDALLEQMDTNRRAEQALRGVPNYYRLRRDAVLGIGLFGLGFVFTALERLRRRLHGETVPAEKQKRSGGRADLRKPVHRKNTNRTKNPK